MKKVLITITVIISITQFGYAQWTSSGSDIYNSNTGNVGIGTTSPSGKLHVASLSSGPSQILIDATDAYNTWLGFMSSGSVKWLLGSNGHTAGDLFTIGKATGVDSSIPYLSINNSSGNVGIGTISPATTLHIKGSGATGPNSSNVPLIIEDPTGGAGQNKWGIGTRIIPNSFAIQDLYNSATRFYIDGNGNVGIGTTDAHGYKFAVNGSAIATSMTVQLYANWPDYVFKKDYRLPALADLKNYIYANHRLPGMPSAQEVSKNGVDLGKINNLLVKKIEDMTLYLIENDKTVKEQSALLKSQQEQINKLEEQVARLIKPSVK